MSSVYIPLLAEPLSKLLQGYGEKVHKAIEGASAEELNEDWVRDLVAATRQDPPRLESSSARFYPAAHDFRIKVRLAVPVTGNYNLLRFKPSMFDDDFDHAHGTLTDALVRDSNPTEHVREVYAAGFSDGDAERALPVPGLIVERTFDEIDAEKAIKDWARGFVHWMESGLDRMSREIAGFDAQMDAKAPEWMEDRRKAIATAATLWDSLNRGPAI